MGQSQALGWELFLSSDGIQHHCNQIEQRLNDGFTDLQPLLNFRLLDEAMTGLGIAAINLFESRDQQGYAFMPHEYNPRKKP